MQTNDRNRLYRFIPVFIFLVALAARIIPGPRTIDDSFITFRYARNILAGNGFVYNIGEHVLGTTTPLYAMLMAVLGAFAGGSQAPFPLLALGLNALADAAATLLIIAIGRHVGLPRAGIGAALAWALAPYSVSFAIGGLETSVYVLLLISMLAGYLYGRYMLVGLAAALALLTRPDALLLVLPLGFDRLFFDPKRRGVRISKKELLAFFLPVVLWYSFAAISFGSLMPHSLTAKEFAYRMQPLSALVRLIQHYATPFMGNLTLGIPWIGIGGLLYLFLFTLGAFRLIKQQPFLWPFVLFPWFYLAAFAIQNPLIFRWYLTPPLPFYIFVVLAGLDHLTSQVFSAKSSRLQFSGLLPVLLVILAPALLIAKDWRLHPTHGLQTPAPEMAYYELELLYKRVADELAPMVQSYAHTPTLAAGDVGILGYYTSARILDTVGLISPETIAYYPLDDYYYDEYTYAVSADLILDHKPDFIVILEVYGRTGLLVDPRFIKAYQLYKKIPTNIYGSDGMLIFVPRTSP